MNEIQTIKIGNKIKHFYSFATKYCSHHNQIEYPIFDSYVDTILCFYKKVLNSMNSQKKILKTMKNLSGFKEIYGLFSAK